MDIVGVQLTLTPVLITALLWPSAGPKSVAVAPGTPPKLADLTQRSLAENRGKRAGPGLSFHCLRHTATSLMKEAGIPGATVRNIIDHESKR